MRLNRQRDAATAELVETLAQVLRTHETVGVPRNLDIKQAADYLCCKVHWLRLEVKRGRITPLVFGHRYVFAVEELLRYRTQAADDAGCAAAVR